MPPVPAQRVSGGPSLRAGRVRARRPERSALALQGGSVSPAAGPAAHPAAHPVTRRLRILTWHTHGSYLLYLAQAPHDFYVLSKPGRPAGYAGRSGHLPWGDNVHDLPADEARRQAFDCIVFQDDAQYLEDQYELLTPAQR